MINYTEKQLDFETMFDDAKESSFFANYDNIIIEKKEEKAITANTNNVYKDTQEQEAYNRLTDEYKEYTVKNNILPTALISGFGDFVLKPVESTNIVTQKEIHVNEKTEELNKVIENEIEEETEIEVSNVITIEEVRDLKADFLTFKKNRNGEVIAEFDPKKFVDYFNSKHIIRPCKVSNSKNKEYIYYRYENGVFIRISEAEIRKMFTGIIDKYSSKYNKTWIDLSLSRFHDMDNQTVIEKDFNARKELICFKNGVYNTKTRKLVNHDPKYLFTSQIPYEFDPSQKESVMNKFYSKWENRLFDEDKEKIKALHEFYGLTISNYNGYEAKSALFVVGAGNTGKSFIFRILSNLVGAENTGIHEFTRLDDPYATSSFYQKRLVGSADMDLSEHVSSVTTFKQTSAGDMIRYEQKFEVAFNFIYRGTILYCCNALPRIKGDKGSWVYDRMFVLNASSKSVSKEERDPNLCEKIMKYDMDYILHMAIDGLHRLIDNRFKFTQPSDLGKTIETMKTNDNPVIQFLQEEWDKGTKDSVFIYHDTGILYSNCSTKELYAMYREYCSESGFNAMNKNNFTMTLNDIGFKTEQKKIDGINKRRVYKEMNTPFDKI